MIAEKKASEALDPLEEAFLELAKIEDKQTVILTTYWNIKRALGKPISSRRESMRRSLRNIRLSGPTAQPGYGRTDQL